MSDQEVWCDVPDWPKYKISTHGRVQLAGGRITFGHSNNGYLSVGLCRGSTKTGDYEQKTKGVHVLVGLAFIPLVPGKTQINHIDCNRSNNHYTNLEWVTAKENNNYPPTRAKKCASATIAQNRRPAKKGFYKKPSGRFLAQIKSNGKWTCLGTYDTTQEARLVYLRAWFEKQTPLNATQLKNLLQALQELRQSCVNAKNALELA